MTGLTRSTLYLMRARNQFPKPVLLGSRSVCWSESSVNDWITSRITGKKVSYLYEIPKSKVNINKNFDPELGVKHDYVSINLAKSEGERLRAHCKKYDISINKFIRNLINSHFISKTSNASDQTLA